MNTEKIWHAAFYIRLSKEDYDSKSNLKAESDSVTAQNRILNDFIKTKSDIRLIDTYVDDGVSGSTSDRPEFQRMINDIERGLIDCVICKDSTRFMRNQAEAIKYRDEYFVEKGVRYISVLDNKDQLPYQQKPGWEFLSDSVKDLFSEYYLVEASEKIRNSLDNRRKNGLFVGSHAPYGYMKDSKNKNHLVVDNESAQIVRQIFKWFYDGVSISNIVRNLNQQGIDNPTVYKKNKGINVGTRAENNIWSDNTVRRILSNEVYIGNLVQGKNKKLSYKAKKSYTVPKDEQIVVNGTHEAIIDIQTFESVQSLLKKGGHASTSRPIMDLFSGFIVCGDCGRKMSIKTNKHDYGTYRYYRCVTNTKTGLDICHSKPSIRADVIENTVLKSIQKMARVAVDMERAVNAIDAQTKNNITSTTLELSLKKLNSDLKKAEKEKLGLYSSYAEEVLTKEEYFELKTYYTNKINELNEKIELVQKESDSLSDNIIVQNEFVDHFKQYGNVDKLTRSMLNELVDSIKVYNNKQIEINFKFQDIFQQTLEFIESQNK